MSPTRLIFLGTPQSAVPSLEALLANHTVAAVVTRPDRPRDRRGRPLPSPVKQAAIEASVPVFEADRAMDLRADWFHETDVAVVVAYGVLIPSELLAIPARGFLNLHFSLLPRWRGATPVVAAIAAGDEETGVTMMELDEGLDTGPIVAARSTAIGSTENTGKLTARLAKLGAELLIETLPGFLSGQIESVRQDDRHATYAPRLKGGAEPLDLTADPVSVARRVRALAPKPGVVYHLRPGQLRLLLVSPSSRATAPGQLEIDEGRVYIGLESGAIELLEVQEAGRVRMLASDWARGWRRP